MNKNIKKVLEIIDEMENLETERTVHMFNIYKNSKNIYTIDEVDDFLSTNYSELRVREIEKKQSKASAEIDNLLVKVHPNWKEQMDKLKGFREFARKVLDTEVYKRTEKDERMWTKKILGKEMTYKQMYDKLD